MTADVRPGYKKTDAGVIPDDWNCLPLRDLLVRGRLGGNYENSERETPAPLMKMGNIGRGSFSFEKVEYIQGANSIDPQHLLKPGDVLFNTRNTLELVGKTAIWRDQISPAYYNSNLMRLEFNDSKIPSTEYANFSLNSESSISRLKAIATGTTSVAAIYTRDLLNFTMPVPPRSEQISIGNSISDVEFLIDGLDELIAKKRNIQHAAMQQLLAAKRRLPGFSGDWFKIKLGDAGALRGGSGFPNKYQGECSGGIPFYKVSDMNNEGNDIFMSTANNYINDDVRKLIGGTIFPTNSIVFAKVGAAVFLERKKILTRPSCIDNNMAAFVPDERRINVRFLHYTLINIRFGDLVSTTALPSLSSSVLSSIELLIPPLAEQDAIATVLVDMDSELAILETRRNKARQIKQGMMQELLTGRIRLV